MDNTVTMAGLAKEIYPIDKIQQLEQLEDNYSKEVPEGTGLEFSAVDGGSFNFAVKASGPHGQQMMNELENLPQARNTNVVQGKSFVKEYAGVIQFTKRELELAKGAARSFSDVKTLEMEGLIQNAHKYFNRQMVNGDGSGLMTTMQAAVLVTVTTLPVNDATPFQIAQVLDIYDAAGTTRLLASVLVTDIDFITVPNTITIDTGAPVGGLPINAQIYLAGVHENASTDGKEMIGLPLVTDDGTLSASFQNIVRTGADEVPNYRGITLSAGGPLSETLINQIITRAYRISGVNFIGSNDAYWLMSPEQWRTYANLSTAQIRFIPSQAPDLNKPLTIMECMGKRVVQDTDVALDRVYIIKKSEATKRAIARPLDWEEDLGGTSLKWLSGTAQGIMLLYSLQQQYSQNPRACAAITDLTVPAI